MILAPWRDPIYFIIWLILLELTYFLLFSLDPLTQLGVIFAYLTGWIIGRKLFDCYEDDMFVSKLRPWDEDSYIDRSEWLDQIINMFQPILDF